MASDRASGERGQRRPSASGPRFSSSAEPGSHAISARTGLGLDELHRRLLALSAAGDAGEGAFSARARHVQALARAAEQLAGARAELGFERLELAAEALAQAHSALGEIGGRLSADGLLGHIFGSFCIGK